MDVKKAIDCCSGLNRNLVYSAATVLIFSSGAMAESAKTWQALLDEGDIDISQQKLAQAEDCYRQALKEVKRTAHGGDDTAKCIERLASTLALEYKANEAIPLYNKSLHIREEAYGKDSPKLVPPLFALGSIFESQGDFKVAMGYYSRALAINEKNYGPLSSDVANSLHRLGRANAGAGQTELAEHNYKSSLSILMQQPSLSSSKEMESLLTDYHDLLTKNDMSDKNLISDFQTEILKDRSGFPVPTMAVPASAWQKQMADLSTKKQDFQNNEEEKILLRGFKRPLNDSTLAPAYNAVSDVLYNQHPYKQGQDYYERMIAIDIKALGPNHPSVADDLTGLALLYISEHKYAEAKPLLIRALSIYERIYGSDNMLVTRTRAALALVLNKLGDTQEALAIYGEALSKGSIALQPNTIETARMLNELGFLYYSQGKLEDACTIYQWALASTRGAVGEHNILVAACLIDYANVLRALGRNAQADEMEEEVRLIKFAQLDSGVRMEEPHL